MLNRARSCVHRLGLPLLLLGVACANNTISLNDAGGSDDGSLDDESGLDGGTQGSDGPGATSMIGGDSGPSDPSAPSATNATTGPIELFCGDGFIGPDEDCDGTDLGAETCESLGAFGGSLECDENCTFAVESCAWEPPMCGNGIAESGEACDGLDLGGATCSDTPGATGSGLACTEECELDPSACAVADGAVVISEIFYSPLAIPLSVPGQWLELHNPGGTTVDLAGCTVDGGTSFEVFAIGNLSIPPGGYVSLGTGTPGELGMSPDFTIPPGFILMNDGDTIDVQCGDELLDSVEYGSAEPWPPFQPGIGIAVKAGNLKPFTNDEPEAWCPAASEYGLGQLGTPGAANDCF